MFNLYTFYFYYFIFVFLILFDRFILWEMEVLRCNIISYKTFLLKKKYLVVYFNNFLFITAPVYRAF